MARAMPIPLAERPVFVIAAGAGRRVRLRRVPGRAAGRRDRRARPSSLLVARGGDLDAADAAAAGAGRPLAGCRASRGARAAHAARARRAAGRAGHHRRLRPLRADRRPPAVRQRLSRHGARPRRRADRERAPLRLARVLRRRDAARPAAHRRRRDARACWWWRSTTSSRASRWSTWRASTSRS